MELTVNGPLPIPAAAPPSPTAPITSGAPMPGASGPASQADMAGAPPAASGAGATGAVPAAVGQWGVQGTWEPQVSPPAGWAPAPPWAMPPQAMPQDQGMAQAGQQATMPAVWNQAHAMPQQQTMPVALAQPTMTQDGIPVPWMQTSAVQSVAPPMPQAIRRPLQSRRQ